MSINYIKQCYEEICTLNEAGGVLSWDQEVMMPSHGAAQRAKQLAILACIAHEKLTQKDVGLALEDIDPSLLDEEDKADYREFKRDYENAVCLPKSLVEDIALKTSIAQGEWAKARAQSDFNLFKPFLKEIITLRKQEAQYLRKQGDSLYDTLLGQYEVGMQNAEISMLFDELQKPLSELAAEISQKPQIELKGVFPKDKQLQLVHKLAKIFQYPFDSGRIDLSTHPFSSGHFDDTRITTRVDESDPFNCIYSTIHEIGHATYEHQIDRKRQYRPHGRYASMGVHESQSRFAENQIGRSKAFMPILSQFMVQYFGDGEWSDADWLFKAVNRVKAGFIRTEADELHYNQHVFLRYGLEKDIFDNGLDVEDLEQEWNERFEASFFQTPPNAAKGILQDVHWSVGFFGYFPTYALGNIFAANLHEKLHLDIPDFKSMVKDGNLGEWRKWMKENIHQYGRLYEGKALIEKAIGKSVSSYSLLNYLSDKFRVSSD